MEAHAMTESSIPPTAATPENVTAITPGPGDTYHGNPETNANDLAADPDIKSINHKKCEKVTRLDQHRKGLAYTLEKDPGLFLNLPCDHCGGNHPIAEFTWADGTALPTRKA
jgi:hypothetical protein